MSEIKLKMVKFNPEYKDDAELLEKANKLSNFSAFVKESLRKADINIDIKQFEVKLKESKNENS